MNWTTVASLATAAGTLVLALATFSSVRSANRAARAAERSLLAGLRPLLMPSQLQDPSQKIMFGDGHWLHAPGGGAVAEFTDDAVYLAMSVRNAGNGIAVLHGWIFHPDRVDNSDHPDPGAFRRLSRDIYVAAGAIGFWQGALREPDRAEFTGAREAITARSMLTVDLLYG